MISKDPPFRFEVWAYRKLTEEELIRDLRAFMAQRDRRRSLRNKTIQLVSNRGMIEGL